MNKVKVAAMAASAVLAPAAIPSAQAQHGPWGPDWNSRGWNSSGWNEPLAGRAGSASRVDPRTGRVDVSRFVAGGSDAALLGHGAIAVESESGDGPWVDPALRASYEAAIVDALVGAGYDTLHSGDPQGQVARLRVTRQVLVPAEVKRSPVSGTAAVEVGSHGSAYGLGINVDLTKPRPALVSTRLDARILDRTDGKVLWEGYATIATPEGDDAWNESRIAGKLAAALFDKFPSAGTMVSPAGGPAD